MGASLLTTIASVTRNLLTGLVLAGLLLVPVTCTMVGHPHSVFDTPGDRHATRSHVAHTGEINGVLGHDDTRPPLADPAAPPALPMLHPGTVTGWLVAHSPAAGMVPAATDFPTVTTTAMVMVASSLSALHATLLALLAVMLIATLTLVRTRAMTGRTTVVPAPPPRRLAVI